MNTNSQNLVLVPGLLCTEALWAHQTRHLADIARCTVANVTAHDSIDALARAVLAQSPQRFALCGLSLGGIIALRIMQLEPARVERLALIDTTARPETPEQTERRMVLVGMARDGRFDAIHDLLLPALVHPERVADRDLGEAVRAMAMTVGPDAFQRQIKAVIGRDDPRPRLGACDLPTLLICGREDAITPLEFHEEMAALMPAAKLAVIEQCGHLSTMERPQAVTALLRQWLQYG